MDEVLLSDKEWQAISCQLGLSGRELEILRCAANGEKELSIANQLAISFHTVHTHLHRLYRKLGVSNRMEAVVLVFRTYIALNRQQSSVPGNREYFPSDRAAA
jgi:ATP/maltotriose-dependent transcriptional regulator MalT